MVSGITWSGDQVYAEATLDLDGQRYRLQRLAGLYYVMGFHISRAIFSEEQLLNLVRRIHDQRLTPA